MYTKKLHSRHGTNSYGIVIKVSICPLFLWDRNVAPPLIEAFLLFGYEMEYIFQFNVECLVGLLNSSTDLTINSVSCLCESVLSERVWSAEAQHFKEH